MNSNSPLSIYFSFSESERLRKISPVIEVCSSTVISNVEKSVLPVRSRARLFITNSHYISALPSHKRVCGKTALYWWTSLSNLASSGCFRVLHERCTLSHKIWARWVFEISERVVMDIVHIHNLNAYRNSSARRVPMHPEFDFLLRMYEYAKRTSMPYETCDRFLACLHGSETCFVAKDTLLQIWNGHRHAKELLVKEWKRNENRYRKPTHHPSGVSYPKENYSIVDFCSKNIEIICECPTEARNALTTMYRICKIISQPPLSLIQPQSLLKPAQTRENKLKGCSMWLSCISRDCADDASVTPGVPRNALNPGARRGGARTEAPPIRSVNLVMAYIKAVLNKDIIGIRLRN